MGSTGPDANRTLHRRVLWQVHTSGTGPREYRFGKRRRYRPSAANTNSSETPYWNRPARSATRFPWHSHAYWVTVCLLHTTDDPATARWTMPANDSGKSPYRMEFDVGTIKHLGLQMYSTLPPAIGELVANGWDANATHVDITIPTGPLGVDTSEITICGQRHRHVGFRHTTQVRCHWPGTAVKWRDRTKLQTRSDAR